MNARLVRAAGYRRQALAARTLAEASALDNVREKHERAAERWTALALLDEEPIIPRPLDLRPRKPRASAEATSNEVETPCTA